LNQSLKVLYYWCWFSNYNDKRNS